MTTTLSPETLAYLETLPPPRWPIATKATRFAPFTYSARRGTRFYHRVTNVNVKWINWCRPDIETRALCGSTQYAGVLVNTPPDHLEVCPNCTRKKRFNTVTDSHRVYFATRPDGLIKIGYTKDLKQRMRMLGVELIATVRGGRALESALHHRFARSRVEGEWFKPTDDLLAYINTDADKAIA